MNKLARSLLFVMLCAFTTAYANESYTLSDVDLDQITAGGTGFVMPSMSVSLSSAVATGVGYNALATAVTSAPGAPYASSTGSILSKTMSFSATISTK
jgi:hypothetical protein